MTMTIRSKPECFHIYPTVLDEKCGAYICVMCDNHKGLEHCFCGWSITGLDGR